MADTILVIDDDPQITAILNEHITKNGFTPVVAHTYEEGLAALKNHPTLAIVDIMLGNKSGLDLIKEAKKDPSITSKFMVLTNSIDAVHIAEAMESGVTTFVQKADHDPEEIMHLVLELLRRK